MKLRSTLLAAFLLLGAATFAQDRPANIGNEMVDNYVNASFDISERRAALAQKNTELDADMTALEAEPSIPKARVDELEKRLNALEAEYNKMKEEAGKLAEQGPDLVTKSGVKPSQTLKATKNVKSGLKVAKEAKAGLSDDLSTVAKMKGRIAKLRLDEEDS